MKVPGNRLVQRFGPAGSTILFAGAVICLSALLTLLAHFVVHFSELQVAISVFELLALAMTLSLLPVLFKMIRNRSTATETSSDAADRYRLLLDSLPGAVTYVDADWRYTYVNHTFEKWLGCKAEDILNRPVREVIGDDAWEGLSSAIDTALAGGENSFDIVRRFDVRGVMHGHFKVSPDIAPDGTMRGFFTLLTDVSETYLAKERFRDFVEISSDWYWETDVDGIYTMISGLHEEKTGVSGGLTIGGDRDQFLSRFAADDRESNPGWIRVQDAIARHAPYDNFSYSVTTRDNKKLTIEVSARPVFDAGGQFTGYRGIGRDVSEDQHVLDLLTDSIESFSTGFALFDKEDRLVLFNSHYHTMVENNAPGSLEIGCTFEELLNRWTVGGAYVLTELKKEEFIRERLRHHRAAPNQREHLLVDGRWVLVSEYRTLSGGIALVQTDITERKLIQDAIAVSEERLSTIMNLSPEAIIAVNQEGVIEIFSAGAERTFGYTADEIIGQHLNTLLPERFRMGHMDKINGFVREEVASRGMADRGEIFGLTKDGREFPALAGISKIENADSLLLTVILQDITERKKVEDALRLIFDSAPVPLVLVQSEPENIVHANRAATDLLQISAADVRGVCLLDQFVDQNVAREVKGIFEGKGSFSSLESRMRGVHGDDFWALCSGQTLDYQGKPSLLFGFYDISQRKEAEDALMQSRQDYQNLMEGSIQGVLITSIDRKPLFANQKCAEIFGYDSAEELLKLDSTLNLIAPHEIERLSRIRQPFVTDKAESVSYEFEGIRKDGSQIWLGLQGGAVEWKGQRAAHLALVDITERRQAEEDRRQALVEAEHANQAKSDFLATMSHELRTPLNAIIGFSDMIGGQYFGQIGSPKYIEYAHDIKSSSVHLLELVNDILDLSAIEAGKQPLNKEDLVVVDVVTDCTPIISAAATEKGVHFSIDITNDLPIIHADKRALKQILFNLLSNAVKYTRPGGKISLLAAALDTSLVFTISDTGVGVSADKLETLTDPFVRSESDPLVAQEGSGLGLAIVKSLVEMHDGKLNIESEVGVGTKVTVVLP